MIRKITCGLLPIFFFGQVALAQMKLSAEDYISIYKDIAIREMKRSGIPASITLAQGILESGNGNSVLATQANNHFGIKCHGWEGKKYYHDDDKKDECFRVYKSSEQSYFDHSEFLRTRSRYAFLFKLDINDYKGWAYGLKKAGYATNPKYPQLLISLVERYELNQYDNPDYKEEKLKEPAIARKEREENEHSAAQDRNSDRRRQQVALRKGEFEINNVKVIQAGKGDTPLEIATLYRIPLGRLLAFNDMDKNAPLQEGDYVYLERKRNKAKSDYHIVEKGETMQSISQQYGIKLKKLYRRNKIDPSQEPEVGEKLYLNKRRKKVEFFNLKNIFNKRKQESNEQAAQSIYTVQKGDTLYAISKKHNLSVGDIKKLNNLSSNTIYPGRKLKVSE